MLTVGPDWSIHLTRGDTARFAVSINNIANNSIYEIAETDTLTLSVKKRTSDEDPLVEKRVVGHGSFHIMPVDTKTLAFGKYVYDVQLETESGDVYTVIPPTTFELLKEVTW